MLRTRRTLVIVGIAAFLITSALVALRSFYRPEDRFVRNAGSAIDRPTVRIDFVFPNSSPANTDSVREFRWNWKDSQELKADQSLRNAKLTERRKNAIASALVEELRPMMFDLGFESEYELRKAALDTRIKLMDLNGDGVAEVVAQGMAVCSATGNCPFWVLRRVNHSYEPILEGEAQTFTIQNSTSNGFHDIVLSTHGSASSGGLTRYQYKDGSYHDVDCYSYEWTVLENEKVIDLKEPRITPCR